MCLRIRGWWMDSKYNNNNIPPFSISYFNCFILFRISPAHSSADPHLRSSVHLTQLRNRFRIGTPMYLLYLYSVQGSMAMAFKLALKSHVEEQPRPVEEENSNKLILTPLVLTRPLWSSFRMPFILHPAQNPPWKYPIHLCVPVQAPLTPQIVLH